MHENRSSERRRLTPRLAALLLTLAAALAALLLGSVGVGQAQTAASLIEVEGGGTQIGFEGERALGFRTGASAGTGNDGWVVTEVELRIRPDDGTGAIRTATPQGLALCEAISSGDPDPNGTCFHLTAPRRVQIPAGTTTGQEVTYTAPGYGHFLATDTEYTLHFTENGSTDAGGVHNLDASDNDGEAVSVAGAFANVMRELTSGGGWRGSTSSVAWARITGYASATPPESQVLVSNIGQGGGSSSIFPGSNLAQAFTTGDSDAGYTLTSIELLITSGSNAPTVTLHSGSATGLKVADFTRPSGVSNGSIPFTFTSITAATLIANTEYWVVAEGSNSAWTNTSQDAEDAGAKSGWSIANVGQSRSATSTGNFADRTNGYSYKLRVNGTVNPIPVLASNIGHSATSFLALTTFDLAQPFTVGSHDAGYRLASIDIRLNTGTTGTTTPTLTLHSGSGTGTKVADFTGPSALDPGTGSGTAKNYTFRPTTPVTLAASTEYWLVVQGSGLVRPETSPSDHEDGTPLDGASIGNAAHSRSASSTGAFAQHDASTPVLKISVRGVRLNTAATGAPVITAPNVFRVPAVLTADISGIADSNGVTKIADSAAYTWHLFEADGTTLVAYSIGTGSTYTLTDAEAGKKLKVWVSFQDDDNYGEGPLRSVETAAITAAASCAAPTLTGGAAFLEQGRKVTVERHGMSPNLIYGFSAAEPAGNLDDLTFTTADSNNYDIQRIHTTGSSLEVGLDTALTAAEKRTVALHVCDQAYAFKSGSVSGSTYTFTTPSLNWESHAERMVYLSQDTVVPTFVSVTVNGTSLVMTFSEELGAAASLANSAFTVKKGSGGTTQTLSSTAPSISGSTVTLTLATASAVTATDTDVKVLYTKPTTGTANKLVDAFGNEVVTFTADQDVGNLLADQVPPTLSSGQDDHLVAADGVTLTLKFSEPLKTSSVPAASAFTVKATPAGGSEAKVTLASSDGVTVSGSTVALELAVPITHNDSLVKVTYEKPGTGAVIEDANGNDAASFTDQPVGNFSAVVRVSIEAVHADASPGIAHAEFRVTSSSSSANALTVNISITQADTYLASTTETITIAGGQTSVTKEFQSYYEGNTSGDLTATVAEGAGYAPAVAPNNAATVEMKVPSSGRTLTIAHQQGAYSVTEGGSWSVTVTFSTGVGVAQPRQDVQASLSTQSGTAISGQGNDFRTYSVEVTVAASDWTAASGAFTATKTITNVTYQDDEYEGSEQFNMRLHRSNPSTVPALFAPTCPPGMRDGTACVATVTITADDDTLEVSSVEVTTTPTGGYYDFVEDIDFTATLNGKVNVTGAPEFAFELGGETRRADYTPGASNTTKLVFRYVVATGDGDDHDGISWGANAFSLNGGTIKFMHTDVAQQVNANLDHAAQGALPSHKVDTTKPSLESASAMDTALTLTFSEELNTTAPATTAFTVKVDGGTGVNPTAASISGSVVTLTLASAVTAGQTVAVTYAKPTTNKIKDLSGKEADSFTDENAPTAPPVEVTVTFTQASYTVAEGANVDVTVRLDKDPERTLTIPLTATGSSGATASDFSVPASVTFTSGETEKMVTFTATHDTEDDDEETVRLTFGTLPTAVTPGGLTQTTVNITDDDDPEVTVSFAEASYAVAEGGQVTVKVRLSADPERMVEVPLTATAQGGATASDFSVPASVTFAGSETEKMVTFTATQDTEDDDGESVMLGFGTLPDRVIAGAAATVSITDDDGPGVNVTPQMLRVVQGRSATYRVTLNTRPTGNVTVTPASDNPDVTFEPATLTFMPAAWNSAQSVTVSAPAGSAGQSATISHTVSGYAGVTTVPGVTVTVTPPPSSSGGAGGGFGPAPTAPSFVDGFRVSRPPRTPTTTPSPTR